MSANINEVDVTITLESQAITREGFGIGILIGANKYWNERTREYTSLSEKLNFS